MDWVDRLCGSINAFVEDVGLPPCIVLGVYDWDAPAMSALRLRDGIFRIGQQAGGLSCNQHDLVGAVLPLSHCNDPALVKALSAVESIFAGTDDEALWRPTLEQVTRVAAQLARAGLSCERSFRAIEEAFVPFDLNEAAYARLRERCPMITRLREDGWRVEVVETAPLRWPTMRALVDELLVAPAFAGHAAFIYENSD